MNERTREIWTMPGSYYEEAETMPTTADEVFVCGAGRTRFEIICHSLPDF